LPTASATCAAPALARLYPPELLAETLRIAARCDFSLAELRYEYPEEVVPAGETPAFLRCRANRKACAALSGMACRTRCASTGRTRTGADRELAYAPYFLTVYDIVLCPQPGHPLPGARLGGQLGGVLRLGITEVDPARSNLLFERFISKERGEPPDIDVDFEHQRREEVIQYLYAKYGRERAALAAAVICYRTRGALRDAGRALGFGSWPRSTR
jgi:error-prone DNA polymerase